MKVTFPMPTYLISYEARKKKSRFWDPNPMLSDAFINCVFKGLINSIKLTLRSEKLSQAILFIFNSSLSQTSSSIKKLGNKNLNFPPNILVINDLNSTYHALNLQVSSFML